MSKTDEIINYIKTYVNENNISEFIKSAIIRLT